jgi:AcrR family transcriptional regulator
MPKARPPRRRAARRPRWRRRPEARPEEILHAALTVFGERGFAQTRLEDVARKAGVSKGTLYLYFDSKDALFRAVVRAVKGPALAEAEAFVEGFEGSAREALVHLIRRMWELMAEPEHLTVSRLVQSEIRHFPELGRFFYEEIVLRSRRLLERVLERGAAAGEFRPEQARFAARAIPAMGLAMITVHGGLAAFDPSPMSREAMAAHATDLILHGVLAPAGPRNDA